MGKTRVGVLLREVGGKSSGNQSADLVQLTERYHIFVKRLRSLIDVLQAHHAGIIHLEKTRTAVANNFAALTKDSPLFDTTGLMPNSNRPAESVCSYCSVHDIVSSKTKSYATKYKEHIIDYVIEWEKTVSTRISNGLKKGEDMRRELDHYQKKVEALRLSVNQTMAKGKPIKPDIQEKLKRNEEKLIQAKQSYNKVATALCLLLDEVTERNWRDIHPVLLKCTQFDLALSNDEAKALATLDRVATQIKHVGTTNGISPQHRLKDLGTLNPELLSTRPGGIAGFQIEDGGGGFVGSPISGATSPTTNNDFGTPMAQPPGTVAPQGLGGFPVQLASSDPPPPLGPAGGGGGGGGGGGFARSASFGPSNSNHFSGFDRSTSHGSLQITPAPPPTLEDVYSYNNNNNNNITMVGASRSAPGSGNLPPFGPGMNGMGGGGGGSMHSTTYSSAPMRSSSFGGADDVSVYSNGGGSSSIGGGYMAAAAAAQAPLGAPPPPPMAPPPPPPPPTSSSSSSSTYGMPPPIPNNNTTTTTISPFAPPPQMPQQPDGQPSPAAYSQHHSSSFGGGGGGGIISPMGGGGGYQQQQQQQQRSGHNNHPNPFHF